jgi:hypothetical protein
MMNIGTVAELLYLNERYFQLLHENGVRIEDVQYLEMYRDYKRLSADGLKQSYIVAHLSAEYDIPERTIYRVIARLSKPVVSSSL